jgi:hypothetical protein
MFMISEYVVVLNARGRYNEYPKTCKDLNRQNPERRKHITLDNYRK